MRIALVASPVFRQGRIEPYTPLGLLALGAELVATGHSVHLWEFGGEPGFDGPLSADAFVERAAHAVGADEPELVGFSTMGSGYALALRLAAAVHRRQPRPVIVFGGPHATSTARETLQCFPWVDFVLRGESDHTLPALVEQLGRGAALWGSVPGAAFRTTGGDVICPPSAVVANLATLRPPAYGLLGRERVRALARDGLLLEAGRGCPYRCAYCTSAGASAPRHRTKPVEHVLRDMRWLRDEFGVERYSLVHDTFTASLQRTIEFCERLAQALPGISWKCSSRADRLPNDVLAALKRSGCDEIFIGMESGSPAIQRAYGKHLDLPAAEEAIGRAVALRFRVTVSLMHGFPEETEADLGRTLALAVRIRNRGVGTLHSHMVAAYPDTPLFDGVRERLALGRPASDQAGSRPADAVDDALVVAHPDIFSIAYRVPTRLPERIVSGGSCYVGAVIRVFPATLAAACGEDPARHFAFLECWVTGAPVEPSTSAWDLAAIARDLVARLPAIAAGAAPWVQDLARLEYALLVAGLAGGAMEARRGALSAIRSPGLRPGMTVFVTRFNVASWWATLRERGSPPDAPPLAQTCGYLVYREHDGRAAIVSVSPTVAELLATDASTLVDRYRAGAIASPDIGSAVAWLLREGLLYASSEPAPSAGGHEEAGV